MTGKVMDIYRRLGVEVRSLSELPGLDVLGGFQKLGDACYDRGRDVIFLDDSARDNSGILLHELVHWTGAPNRLNRLWTVDAFRGLPPAVNPGYLTEELVAESGALCLLEHLGLATPALRKDSMEYFSEFLSHIPVALRGAALEYARARAREAQNYILGGH